MKANANRLTELIAKHARMQGVTMTELARLCGFSRTTLYRYLRGDSPLGGKEASLLAEALRMNDEEQLSLRAFVVGSVQAPVQEAAYTCLQQVFFQPSDLPVEAALSFAYYVDGEKYLRTSEELCRTIETACSDENTTIRVQAINCAAGAPFSFLCQLTTCLFGASPFVTMEHLVAFPDNKNAQVASTLARLLPFLRYEGYHALYSSAPVSAVAQEGTPDDNMIYVTVQKKCAKGGTERTYYTLTLYPDGLSQCIRYRDAALDSYFKAHYDHMKTNYRDSLLYSKNLQAFNQELAEFESNSEHCLFKPDPCYNDVPPEAYHSLFGRMTDAEKSELSKVILGRKVTGPEINSAIQGILSTMELRYQCSLTQPYRLVCCRDGLINFAKTGLLTANVASLPPFSKGEREIILRSLYERVAHPEGEASALILPVRLLPNGNIISANRKQGILIDFGGVRQQGFSQNVLLRHATLSELFVQYAYSNELRRIAYPRDVALQFLDELLNSLQKQ